MSDKAEIIQVPKKHGRRWLIFALAVLLVAVQWVTRVILLP